MSVCRCGHVRLMHETGCRACRCAAFITATDPTAAAEAARDRQSTEQLLLTRARRALAMRHYDQALGAVLALLDHDRKETR